MRLKITRKLTGSIDGLQLSHFELGATYDVGTSLGSYLLATGAAEPVNDQPPVGTLPMDETRRRATSLTSFSRSQSADRPARRR